MQKRCNTGDIYKTVCISLCPSDTWIITVNSQNMAVKFVSTQHRVPCPESHILNVQSGELYSHMRGGAATENYGEVAMFLLILDLHYKDDALQLNT